MINATRPVNTMSGVWPSLLGIAAAAALLRMVGIEHRWLWYDELLSANFSVHGVWATLVSVLRFDIHPPLYYLQLCLWALPSSSDIWLMANSVAWSTAAVVLLGYCATRVYGRESGLVAALLLALSPAALAYSDQVRMYSMAMTLVVWCWYAQVRWIEQGLGRAGLAALLASQFCLVYTHSAGLVMLSGVVLFGFFSLVQSGRLQLLSRWLAAEIAVALLALPAVAIALFRQVEHTRRPDLADIIGTWSYLTMGNAGHDAILVAISLALAGVLVAGAVFYKDLRLPIATLVFAPLILAAVVSYVLKPIWLERTFITTVPFICLTLAVLAVRWAFSGEGVSVWRRPVIAALFVALAGLSLTQQFTRTKGDGFRAAAARLQSLAKPGDVVLVDGHFNYWSFLWYYAGPDWGLPQHAFLMQPKWARAMEKIPPSVAAWLDINSSATMIERDGVAVKLWDRTQPVDPGQGKIFIVRSADAPIVEVANAAPAESHVEQNIVTDEFVR